MTSSRRHVRFLASVTSKAEACLAASHGADIIDCKNPMDGALGALAHATVADIRQAVPAHIPVSATIGDLPLEPASVGTAVELMAATGADIVKIGLFPGPAPRDTVAALAPVARRTKLVAVMLADRDPDFGIIRDLAAAGFAGVMLDTAGKTGKTLLDHLAPPALEAFLDKARSSGLMCGLAGSLRLGHLPALLALAPDVLGFRGALCSRSDRTARLDAEAVKAVRHAIHEAQRLRPRELEQSL